MQRPQVSIGEGTLLIRSGTDFPLAPQVETTSYSHNWELVTGRSDLDSSLSNSGWNLFFIATTLTTTCLGASEASLRRGLNRLLKQTSDLALNSLRVTHRESKKFLGFNYQVITAHPCHIQHGCFLESAAKRKGDIGQHSLKAEHVLALPHAHATETNQ